MGMQQRNTLAFKWKGATSWYMIFGVPYISENSGNIRWSDMLLPAYKLHEILLDIVFGVTKSCIICYCLMLLVFIFVFLYFFGLYREA